jgi:hypothetical protein
VDVGDGALADGGPPGGLLVGMAKGVFGLLAGLDDVDELLLGVTELDSFESGSDVLEH